MTSHEAETIMAISDIRALKWIEYATDLTLLLRIVLEIVTNG